MIATELTDIVFSAGKRGEISLASLGLHVENQGVNSVFQLPTYRNVNSVDWQEYDGEDVDFSSASVNPLPLQIKVFGESSVVDRLVDDLRRYSTDSDIVVKLCISEGIFKNKITFDVKFDRADKSKVFVMNDWELQHFYLTDEDSDYIVTEAEAMLLAGVNVKVLRQIAFATITLTRYSDNENSGLLADNTRECQGIPSDRFTTKNYPKTNMPLQFRRYGLNGREAEMVDSFDLYDTLVFCYPVKGVIQGLTSYAPSKSSFSIQTENMVGEILQTKNSDKRSGKTITLPLLIRSHSVSAIFSYLGKLKRYIHTVLKSGDMLYLHSDTEGDFAVYTTGSNVRKAYIKNQPWVEIEIQFCCYKHGFDFSASTDNVPEDNPDPPLPPAPAPTFDPYKDIDRSAWRVMSFSRSQDMYNMNYPLLVSPTSEDGLQYPFNSVGKVAPMIQGWSPYAESIRRYPVGTMFFAQDNTYSYKGKTRKICNTLICLPWCIDKLSSSLFGFFLIAMGQEWNKDKHTLVGVVQGCDVMSDTIENWSSKLQEEPNYGGIVGSGTVRVTKEALRQLNNMGVTIASGLTLTTSDDFDTLVENTILNYEESPLEYYTESGYANSKK